MSKEAMACLITAVLVPFLNAQTQDGEPLIDKELSNFELWMGIPHSSVTGLPAGTATSDNCHEGVSMGLNADIKHVFPVVEDGGEPMLHISGEIYGRLPAPGGA